MDVLSTKTQCNLNNAEKYFKEHLQLGDYYSQENIVSGEWAGIGAEQLGLTGRVKRGSILETLPQPESTDRRIADATDEDDAMGFGQNGRGRQSPGFL